MYTLDQDANPLADIPQKHRVCLLLNAGTGCFGITTDQLRDPDPPLNLVALPTPPCMQPASTPVGELVACGERVISLCAGEAFASYLNSLGGGV